MDRTEQRRHYGTDWTGQDIRIVTVLLHVIVGSFELSPGEAAYNVRSTELDRDGPLAAENDTIIHVTARYSLPHLHAKTKTSKQGGRRRGERNGNGYSLCLFSLETIC
jgi:hypothetical protein